jgi:hypothetical protein
MKRVVTSFKGAGIIEVKGEGLIDPDRREMPSPADPSYRRPKIWAKNRADASFTKPGGDLSYARTDRHRFKADAILSRSLYGRSPRRPPRVRGNPCSPPALAPLWRVGSYSPGADYIPESVPTRSLGRGVSGVSRASRSGAVASSAIKLVPANPPKRNLPMRQSLLASRYAAGPNVTRGLVIRCLPTRIPVA